MLSRLKNSLRLSVLRVAKLVLLLLGVKYAGPLVPPRFAVD